MTAGAIALLTMIAEKITGTHWSGSRFFGFAQTVMKRGHKRCKGAGEVTPRKPITIILDPENTQVV